MNQNAQLMAMIYVDSVEDALDAVKGAGGKIIQGKTPIPGMGWFGVCEDTEGNRIGVFTTDPKAG